MIGSIKIAGQPPTRTQETIHALLAAARIDPSSAVHLVLSVMLLEKISELRPAWKRFGLHPDDVFAVYLGAHAVAADEECRGRLARLLGERQARRDLEALDTEAMRLGRLHCAGPDNRTVLDRSLSGGSDAL